MQNFGQGGDKQHVGSPMHSGMLGRHSPCRYAAQAMCTEPRMPHGAAAAASTVRFRSRLTAGSAKQGMSACLHHDGSSLTHLPSLPPTVCTRMVLTV